MGASSSIISLGVCEDALCGESVASLSDNVASFEVGAETSWVVRVMLCYTPSIPLIRKQGCEQRRRGLVHHV